MKRAPKEVTDADLQLFYSALLSVIKKPVFRDGRWSLLECRAAWDGNGSSESFVAFSWEGAASERAIVTVNYAPHDSQCYLQLPFLPVAEQPIRFRDLMSDASYEREGSEILSKGLYLDLPAWGFHIFELTVIGKKTVEEKNLVVAPKHDLIPA